MNHQNNKSKKHIGNQGESFVIDKLKTQGFELYKKNIKYIDAEIDIVVYKYNEKTRFLNIRVIEVKTRNNYCFDLINFNLIKKWLLVKKYLFKIKSEIDINFEILGYSEIHFDLVLVKKDIDNYCIYSYIEDVNLLL